MTTLDADPGLLEEAAADAVHTYEQRYDDPVPVTMADVKDILRTGPVADHSDVQQYMEEVGAYYEDLLDVDADYVNELREDVRYDPTPADVARDTATPFGAAVAAAGSGAVAASTAAYDYTAQAVPWIGEPVFQGAPAQLAAYSLVFGVAGSLALNYLMADGRYDDWRDWVGIGRTKRDALR